MIHFPWQKVRWANSAFLILTFVTSITAVPWYLLAHGLDAFQISLFFLFFVATGLSITLGYHRLFSHLTFQATWPVKAFTLLFGAAAFEGSALSWCADHRRHHKFVDHDEDPYDISRGFFHAHIGWLLFRTGPDTPLSWVRDLQKDRLAVLQHRYYIPLAFLIGFGLPTAIGWMVGGATAALGAFLVAGVARVVAVHHMTFCINSLCHWIGSRPYSSKCSARDSFLMALFTFGEGYHNFHHEFQHDYRNGVKPWHFDPTKWTIWCLHKLGLVRNLRTVPQEKILRAQITEFQHRIESRMASGEHKLSEQFVAALEAARERVLAGLARWEQLLKAHQEAISRSGRTDKELLRKIRRDLDKAGRDLQESISRWSQEIRNAGGTLAEP